MNSCILTVALVERAIRLVKSSIETILKVEGTTWGPRWVSVVVVGPGLEHPVSTTIGQVEEWEKKWGEAVDFTQIALQKAVLAARVGMPTGVVVSQKPWLLLGGDYFYEGGIAERIGGLAVAVSGAYSQTDSGIASMIYSIIAMLCCLKIRAMQEDNANSL